MRKYFHSSQPSFYVFLYILSQQSQRLHSYIPLIHINSLSYYPINLYRRRHRYKMEKWKTLLSSSLLSIIKILSLIFLSVLYGFLQISSDKFSEFSFQEIKFILRKKYFRLHDKIERRKESEWWRKTEEKKFIQHKNDFLEQNTFFSQKFTTYFLILYEHVHELTKLLYERN